MIKDYFGYIRCVLTKRETPDSRRCSTPCRNGAGATCTYSAPGCRTRTGPGTDPTSVTYSFYLVDFVLKFNILQNI